MNCLSAERSANLKNIEIEQMETQIRSRLGGRACDLRVMAEQNGLVLKGHCTHYAKQLAQHAVMETSELPILANEIEVW